MFTPAKSHWSALIRPLVLGVALGLALVAAGWHSSTLVTAILVWAVVLRRRQTLSISPGRMVAIFVAVLLLHVAVISWLVFLKHHPHW